MPVHSKPLLLLPPGWTSRQPSSIAPAYSAEAFEKELVRAVIDGNWPFRTLERPSFKRFLEFLRPGTELPSRPKFTQMLEDQFRSVRTGRLYTLGPNTKVSIALDAWSASNHLSFLAIKAYYIDENWQLRESLLDFLPLRGHHTGTSMAIEVFRALKDTKTSDRLLAITCDNASNNSTLSCALKSKF